MCYVPHFIEADEVVAKAATAVLFARQARTDNGDNEVIKSRRLYSAALTLLQQRLSGSCADLVVVALFGRYEQIVANDSQALASHVQGLTAILLSKRIEPGMNELAVVFLQMTKVHRLYQPIAQGRPSPFDKDELWVDSDPPQRFFKLSESCQALKKLANKTYIRLPRLIAAMKQARTQRASDPSRQKSALECITLAAHLMAARDPKSERLLLDTSASGTKTERASRDFIPTSFRFSSKEEMYDLLEYWEARLFVINNAQTILRDVTSRQTTGSEIARLRLDADKISSEQHEVVLNILKSFTAFEDTAEGGIPIAIPSAMIAVWGALSTITSLNSVPVNRVRVWFFPKCAKALGHWRQHITMDDLDKMSDMFVGGPTESLFGTDLQLALLYRKYHTAQAG